jgi:hypothetical protein
VLLIGQHLGESQAAGIVDGLMGFLAARTSQAAKAPIATDPVTDAIEPGQLFYVHADHVARPCPVVMPHRHRWLQLFQASQTHGFAGAAECPVSIRLMGGVNLVDRWNQAP